MQTLLRSCFPVCVAGLIAWLVLYQIDQRDPERLHLRVELGSQETCLIHSAYLAEDQDHLVISPAHYLPPKRGLAPVTVPLPRDHLQKVWIRVLSEDTVVELQDLTFRQSGSLFWPTLVIQRMPMEAFRAEGGSAAPEQITPSILRCPLDEEGVTLLRIRPANGMLNAPLHAPWIPHLQRTLTAMALGMLLVAGWGYRNALRRFAGSPACPVIMLVGTTCILLVLIPSLASPIVGSDELSYLQASYGISRIPCPPGFHRLYWELPNLLYVGLGRLAFALSAQGEDLIKGFQVGLYILSCGWWWLLAYRLTTRRWASATLGFVVLLASHSYVYYFMPEILFRTLFTGLAVWWCLGVSNRPRTGLLVSGLLCAALCFVKPHALALTAAVGVGSLLLPWTLASGSRSTAAKLRHSLAGGLLFSCATLAGIVLLSFVLAPFKQEANAADQLGDYTRYFTLLTHGEPITWQLISGYVELATAQLLLAAPYLAAPIYFGWRLWRRCDCSPPVRPEVRLLILFAALTFLATYAMTIHFTFRAAEHALRYPAIGNDLYFRAHGRYYSFVLPLFFIVFAVGLVQVRDRCAGKGTSGIALAGAVVLGLSMVAWALPKAAIMWYDFPEAYGLTTRVGVALALVCLLSQAMAIAFPRRPVTNHAAIVALLLYAGCGSVQTLRAAHQWSFRQRDQVVAGAQFARLIPEAERPATLLVTVAPEEELYFAFSFRYSPLMSIESPSFIPDVETLPPASRWLITHGASNPEDEAHPRLALVSHSMGYRLYAITEPDP